MNRFFGKSQSKGMGKVVILCLLCLCLFPIGVWGEELYGYTYDPYYENPDTGYTATVFDYEDLLTDEEEEKLAEDMEGITAYGNAAFVSAYPEGYSSREFAENNYSQYFKESGTLFLIDMYNRKIWLYNGGEIEKTITPSYSDSITDNVYSYASDGDYYTCASEAFRQETILLEGGKIAQPMKWISAGLLALILAFLINYLIVRGTSKNKKSKEDVLINAIAVAAAITAGGAIVTSRRRKTRSSSSSSSRGGGGGGGGFSGGGHSF
ncbi:MAG: TPM domain-containing protein [Lachnospiraceae bacterium]|nr:TPM domain-containing protein [Lachnospiraceae bacterium]